MLAHCGYWICSDEFFSSALFALLDCGVGFLDGSEGGGLEGTGLALDLCFLGLCFCLPPGTCSESSSGLYSGSIRSGIFQ